MFCRWFLVYHIMRVFASSLTCTVGLRRTMWVNSVTAWLERQKKLHQEKPICVCTPGCQRWLMPCVLKAKAWRFSSILSRPSSCAANCLGPSEKCLSKLKGGLLECKGEDPMFPAASLQHRGAVSCIAVTAHWAAWLALPLLFHHIWGSSLPCSAYIHADKSVETLSKHTEMFPALLGGKYRTLTRKQNGANKFCFSKKKQTV